MRTRIVRPTMASRRSPVTQWSSSRTEGLVASSWQRRSIQEARSAFGCRTFAGFAGVGRRAGCLTITSEAR
eukprot:1755398-Prymnesium_polylepis.1